MKQVNGTIRHSGINISNYLNRVSESNSSLRSTANSNLFKKIRLKFRHRIISWVYSRVLAALKPSLYRFRTFLLADISLQLSKIQNAPATTEIQMKKVPIVLIGAGGHANVCYDILVENGFNVVTVIVAEETPTLEYFKGVPISSGSLAIQKAYDAGVTKAFVAIGSNRTRESLVREMKVKGFELISLVSPRAAISQNVTIGDGTIVMPNAVINSGSHIGDGCIINSGSIVEHDCSVLSGVHLAPGTILAGRVTIGTRSFLGVGCRVLPELQVGSDVIIGAGTTVISDVQSGLKVVGTPARII